MSRRETEHQDCRSTSLTALIDLVPELFPQTKMCFLMNSDSPVQPNSVRLDLIRLCECSHPNWAAETRFSCYKSLSS